MPVENHPPPFTTRLEIEEIFSVGGLDLRIDDDEDLLISTAETETLTQTITEGTDIANMYLLHRYTSAVLADSRWVRRRVSYICCHILSRRLGNAAQFSDEHDKAITDFEMIMSGVFFIPRLTPDDNYEPSLSNQVVDWRYYRDKLRTDPITVQGGQNASRQPLDYTPWGNWGWV